METPPTKWNAYAAETNNRGTTGKLYQLKHLKYQVIYNKKKTLECAIMPINRRINFREGGQKPFLSTVLHFLLFVGFPIILRTYNKSFTRLEEFPTINITVVDFRVSFSTVLFKNLLNNCTRRKYTKMCHYTENTKLHWVHNKIKYFSSFCHFSLYVFNLFIRLSFDQKDTRHWERIKNIDLINCPKM